MKNDSPNCINLAVSFNNYINQPIVHRLVCGLYKITRMGNIWQKCKYTLAENRLCLVIISVYSILLLFFCSQMSPLYPINTWGDANIYFNVGKAVFEGRALYTEAFDHKGPLIFFIYGFGYLISSGSFLGVFIIEAVAWIVMLCMVYFSANLFINKQYSLLAALIFPLFLLKYTNEGGSAEEFVLVFESISLYFFLRYFRHTDKWWHNPRFMLIHGITGSVAFFVKLNLILFWFFPLAAIFIGLLYHKEFRNLLINLLCYIGGFLVVAAPVCIYLYANNALEEAYNVYIVTNSKYASIPPTAKEIISLLANRIYLFVRGDILGSISILLGIFVFPLKYVCNRIGKAGMVLCGISVFVIVSVTGSFFGYYNLPFYIFNVLGWIVIFRNVRRYIMITYSKHILWLFAFICLVIGINQKRFFNTGGDAFFRKSKVTGLISEFAPIIEKEKNPTLLNLGFGYGNAVFTYCNIVPNVSYFITTNLPHDLYPVVRNEQTRYIENKEVEFIILTNVSQNYEYFKTLPALHTNYRLADTYVDETQYHKDKFYTYYLYQRKK